jgi:AcrR family transcriptional regulator
MSREPLVVGLARLFHRVMAGPIEGVNVKRSTRGPRRRVEVVMPDHPEALPSLRPRGEATRARLLEAGATILPARGFHDARVDDIVKAAGVSHGTFYRYFDSKDDFFRALAIVASTRMIDLLDRLELDAPPEELRAWLHEWFDAYEADGGVISTWQDMRTSPELTSFSQQVAASAFTRLERLLARRDFGDVQVDAAMLLALIERVPYSVATLGFVTRPQAIDAAVTLIRRGFLGLDAPG